MSKWIKSTTTKAWVASCQGRQVVIPSTDPADKWLQLDEAAFEEVSKTPVIASLIKAGSIMVLDQEPAEIRNSVPALQVANTQLQADLDTACARIVDLENQLKNASSIDIEAIKAEVRQQCEAEKEQALNDLDAKATQEIESRDKIIEKLEKKIKKLGGESEE